MKRLILLTLTIAILSGCAAVNVKTATLSAEGKPITCEASYSRFWFETEGFVSHICGGDAKVARTVNNTDLLEQLLPLLARTAGVK